MVNLSMPERSPNNLKQQINTLLLSVESPIGVTLERPKPSHIVPWQNGSNVVSRGERIQIEES